VKDWPWTELPRPESVDLVFLLNRPELQKDGYIPAHNPEDETEVSLANLTFLDACLSRVDLRVNAIGITERFCRMSPHFGKMTFEQHPAGHSQMQGRRTGSVSPNALTG
jgi:hypothetical protein